MDEKKIRELAMEYGLKCDPLNQTLEKQADIRQGFIEGMNQALNLFSVSVSLPSREEMDKEIISIMVDNLQVGTGQEEGIICNKFATSLKILDYIEKITGNER